jgi:hypothetical protein
MASYSIVSNARFRPFSYDELVKPLVQYKEAYDKAEADYTNLAMQTEAWRDIANQENSPVAYKMYKTYSDDLSRMVDDFSKGMTLSNRGALMGLKRRYASEITPIARASEAFDKAEAFRADIKAKNPNAVFEIDRYNSIDDFLGGRRPNNAYWDGDSTLKRVAAKAEALGRSLYSNPTAKLFLNGQQYQISQLNGISPEELTQILLHPENINTEAGRQMRKIMEDELSSIDLSKYSLEGQSKINNIIATGMYAGLAKPTYNYVANGEYMSRAERDASSARWASIKLDRDKFDFAKLQDSIESGREPYHITLDGTRYYRAGDAYWTVDKEGRRSEIRYSKKMYDESGNSIGGDSGNKGKLKSAYKDFKIGKKKFVKGSGFNPEKASKWDVAQLNDYQRGELNKYLKEEEGATLDDVDIYVDGDYVRVVPKNTNEYGLVSSMTGDTKMGDVK